MFGIKFSIADIWQGSEYASSSEYDSATQGSAENGPSNMFNRVEYSSGFQYVRAWPGCGYAKVTRGSV